MTNATNFPMHSNTFELQHTPSGLPIIAIRNEWATATVALQGGQLLHYQVHGQPPLIWHSSLVPFKPGAVPRGGIPLLFPWFGIHPSAKDAPRHGLVRLAEWQAQSVVSDQSGTLVTLCHVSPTLDLPFWQASFRLTLQIQIGQQLQLDLVIENTSAQPFTCSGGLHTYFAVSHIGQAAVQGLDGVPFIGSPSGSAPSNTPQVQVGDVIFASEVDNTYCPAPTVCRLLDTGWQRTVVIQQSGANGTVVWNPGPTKSAAISDMNWLLAQGMVCVESIIAPQQPLTLAAGESHHLTVQLSEHTA